MYKAIVMIIMVGLFIGLVTYPTHGVDEDKAQTQETGIISVSGRLKFEPGEIQDHLILYGKDAKVYQIYGEFFGLLKSVLLDLGENNLVSLKGIQDGSYSVACRNEYKFSPSGNRIVETQCIRHYMLNVTQIINAVESNEEMPPPERDKEEEKKARISALHHFQQQGLKQIGEIKGKISSLNIRAPIKTVEVRYLDKDNKPIKKHLLLTSNTLVVKGDIDTKQPVSIDYLKVGQEVVVQYSGDERKTEALFITVTKE